MPDRRASLVVRVHPRAARERLGPIVDGVLQVHVAKPPVRDEANEAVRRRLAEALRVPPLCVELVSGGRGRLKRFTVLGMSPEQVAARLRRLERDD